MLNDLYDFKLISLSYMLKKVICYRELLREKINHFDSGVILVKKKK